MRKNPATSTLEGYYRLVESYRNEFGRVCHRTILNVGFCDDVTPEHLNKIQKHLTERASGKSTLFVEEDSEVLRFTEQLWDRMIQEKRIDLPEKASDKPHRLVNIDSIKHRDVKEVGAEWLSLQALEQLKVQEFLTALGWKEEKVQLAITQIISRAVYPASELKTTRWIKENSAICELSGYPIEKLTKDKLYASSLSLYDQKDALEKHLSKRTNELFDLNDKIILYDLTNTYFEGEKRNSKLAQYGRSKEKRSEAKLVVLALVVNPEGFMKYSNIYQGSTADNTTLPDIIKGLRKQTSDTSQKATVVIDAGIATDENLVLLEKEGYNYVCVSRSSLKDYQAVTGSTPQKILIRNKQELSVEKVQSKKSTDYYLKVKSPGKTLKETSMKTQFESRFEMEMTKLRDGLSKKHSIKKADRIHQRIGRSLEKYPSVSKYYEIEVTQNDQGQATDIKWSKNKDKYQSVVDKLGIYFIRTNLDVEQEKVLWDIYNTIREIESTFRTLKTDLDLRPIYHKKDESTMAHLHLGLLAYWLVNTIRHQLKPKGIKDCWQEIVRKANTQKVITTSGTNQENKIIAVRKCSQPNESLKVLYEALQFKTQPFTKRKSVVHKTELQKIKPPDLQVVNEN
jgi:hypothetical protein